MTILSVAEATNQVLGRAGNDINKYFNNNKRSRPMEEKTSEPPEKLIKRTVNDSVTFHSLEDQQQNTKDPTELLFAYKRIWDNLDLNKQVDAKLEPFVWNRIRYYQHMLKQ